MEFQLLIFGILDVEVFHSSPKQKRHPNEEYRKLCRVTHHQTKTPIQHDNHELSNVDYPPTEYLCRINSGKKKTVAA